MFRSTFMFVCHDSKASFMHAAIAAVKWADPSSCDTIHLDDHTLATTVTYETRTRTDHNTLLAALRHHSGLDIVHDCHPIIDIKRFHALAHALPCNSSLRDYVLSHVRLLHSKGVNAAGISDYLNESFEYLQALHDHAKSHASSPT